MLCVLKWKIKAFHLIRIYSRVFLYSNKHPPSARIYSWEGQTSTHAKVVEVCCVLRAVQKTYTSEKTCI